jgi:hypothetical protein
MVYHHGGLDVGVVRANIMLKKSVVLLTASCYTKKFAIEQVSLF